jgi:hypothetical protein
MGRIGLGAVALALVTLAVAGAAGAQGGGRHEYTVVTTDSGSCKQGWARDTVKRTYRVKKTRSGYRVERRDRGTFVTTGSRSPGACQSGSGHGSTLRAGVRGTMRGSIVGVVTGGVYDPGAACNGSDCGATDVWVSTHFGSHARFACLGDSSACRFAFEYRSGDRGLRYRRWTDRGTGSGSALRERLHGDIAA